jgi:ABC-type sugar transport system substrate-binding protein
MRLTLLTASAAALLAGAAGAETIGVTMQSFNNNFQTLLRHGITLPPGGAPPEIG